MRGHTRRAPRGEGDAPDDIGVNGVKNRSGFFSTPGYPAEDSLSIVQIRTDS